MPGKGRRQLDTQTLQPGRSGLSGPQPCSSRRAHGGHQTPLGGQDEEKPMGQAGAACPGAQGCQGPRSGGWEGGLGLDAPGRSEQWKMGEGQGSEGGRSCLLFWTRKHEPVCRGKEPGETQKQEEGDSGGGRSHRRGWEPGRPPTKAGSCREGEKPVV